jgi:hypothetical protein
MENFMRYGLLRQKGGGLLQFVDRKVIVSLSGFCCKWLHEKRQLTQIRQSGMTEVLYWILWKVQAGFKSHQIY